MASPVDTSVKFFNEGMPGAPVLNGVAGSLIGVLDSCLVTGFGLRSVVSLVVSGGVATATLSSDTKNAALLNSVIFVDGASIGALNGEQKVTVATDVLLKFATAAADGTATGTIAIKSAPAGWEKVFSGTNKAVYKSLDAQSLGMYLLANDTGTLNCNVRGYESMSAVDTGAGPFPTVAESAGGGFWLKSSAANATANRWDLFADSRAFFYCPVPASGANATYVGQANYLFGDVIPFKSGDAFATVITASSISPGVAVQHGAVLFGGQATSISRWPRSYTSLGSSVPAFVIPYSGSIIAASGADSQQGVFPAPVDGGLRISRMYATEYAASGASAVLRGEVPGACYVPQTELNKYFQRGDTTAFGTKKLYAVHSGTSVSDVQATGGRGFFDITGPWR